jgi:hypothetical protein
MGWRLFGYCTDASAPERHERLMPVGVANKIWRAPHPVPESR